MRLEKVPQKPWKVLDLNGYEQAGKYQCSTEASCLAAKKAKSLSRVLKKSVSPASDLTFFSRFYGLAPKEGRGGKRLSNLSCSKMSLLTRITSYLPWISTLMPVWWQPAHGPHTSHQNAQGDKSQKRSYLLWLHTPAATLGTPYMLEKNAFRSENCEKNIIVLRFDWHCQISINQLWFPHRIIVMRQIYIVLSWTLKDATISLSCTWHDLITC